MRDSLIQIRGIIKDSYTDLFVQLDLVCFENNVYKLRQVRHKGCPDEKQGSRLSFI